MTCSNIGADVLGAGKPMIAFERSKKSRSDAGDSVRSDSVNSDKIQANSIDSNRSNSRNSMCANDVTTNCPTSGQKISFKPYEDSPKSGAGRDQQQPQHRSSSKSNGASSNNNNNNNQDDSSSGGGGSRKRSSDAISPKRSPGGSSPKRSSSSSSHTENNKNSSSSASSSSPSNVISYTSTGLLELSKNHQLSKAVCDSSASGFPSQLSHFPPAMSHHHNHDHHNSSHPYNSSSSACRDPFCSGCHMSSLPGLASAAAGNCCNGLSACTHTKAADHPFAAGFPPGINPLTHHLNRFSNGLPSQKPFPCHWTANGSYCGKSFSTCEELLQHLKTHTLTSNTPSPYSGLSSYYSQALGAAGMRPYGLEDLRYHPYKMSGPGSAAAAAAAAAAFQRPPVSLASAAGYPLMTPPMSMYPPGHNSSLSSYYALLHGRLAGHGSLH